MSEVSAAPNPYREIFDGIVGASGDVARLEPHEAYRLYDDELVARGLDPVIYFSMAYTSGGAARDKTLGFGEVIAANTRYADLARTAFLGAYPQFTEQDIVVPSDLGKVKGWSQADFLLFWNHVIVGLEPDDATRIDTEMATALVYPAFHDKSLDAEAKWEGYRRFGDEYVRALCDTPLASRHGPNNMQTVLTILDKKATLGGREEEHVAMRLGIKAERAFLDRGSVAGNEEFATMSQHLARLGAAAIGQDVNPLNLRFVGIMQGDYNPNLAFRLGLRKTGLMNAIFAAEYYAAHPGTRPSRHAGHRPLHSAA